MKGNLVSAEVVEPYAQALISVAKTHGITEEIGNDARALIDLLKNSSELRNFIENPFVSEENKKAVLERVVGEEINAYTRNFLKLLVDKRRILFLAEISEQYLALLRELNQTVLAEITSAIALTEEQQRLVREKVLQITNARNVEFNTTIDPELIGGVIVKVGSQIIDASLRGQLRRIGIRLNSAV
jgi:F-type H+-transporting ATPase subunit delta